MKYDIIIIGGGASGLCTAIMSKNEHNSVLVIEHSDRIGKKILSTGNGKCNLTNEFCKVDLFDSNPENIYPYFSSGDISFVKKVISGFDADDTVKFFRSLGVITESKNGYVYPRSGQASSVLDVFRFKCDEKGIDIVTDYRPQNVYKKNGLFFVDDYSCDSLVIATGGMSAPKTGSDGSGYEIAKQFGHSIIKPLPALCGLKCNDYFFKELSGVRNDSRLSLFIRNPDTSFSLLAEVAGNLQFNDYGISGIGVFQLSSFASVLLDKKHELLIKADLLPEISDCELYSFISKKKTNKLLGILNNKLANVIQKEAKCQMLSPEIKDFDRALVNTVKHFKIHPAATLSFNDAQVTAGGVDTSELNPDSLESAKTEKLYFAGEVIDVNGICGGYNLQWAFACANQVAKNFVL